LTGRDRIAVPNDHDAKKSEEESMIEDEMERLEISQLNS